MHNALTDVTGLLVGHSSNFQAITGCTVVLCPEGAVGGVDVRGFASGSRELDALHPLHLVPYIHGILLAGGSAFGLDAASGVMRFLEEKGIGFDVAVTHVPIVPAAILFDLRIGEAAVRPDAAMGYAASAAATDGPIEEGSVGAGTGATVGKLYGMAGAMKGGLGTASLLLPDGVAVAALVVVNAFGDVRDPESGALIAGARKPQNPRRLADTAAQLKAGTSPHGYNGENTTLAVVATNAYLSKGDTTKLARMAETGLVRALSPVHTPVDGDIVFALSTGKAGAADLTTLGLVGGEVVSRAIVRAIRSARSLGGVPSWADLFSA